MFSLLNMNKIACVPAMEKGLSLMVFAAAPPIVGRGPTSGDTSVSHTFSQSQSFQSFSVRK